MAETPPPGPLNTNIYKSTNSPALSKEEYLHGFHIRLGVDIACADSGDESPQIATQRRVLREQLLATLASVPDDSEWRSVISPRATWGWPELLSSPAYAYARTRPLSEGLALGSGLSRSDLFFILLDNPTCVPDTPEYHMILADLSPPSTVHKIYANLPSTDLHTPGER